MRIEISKPESETPCFVCNSLDYTIETIKLHTESKGTDETPLCLNCRLELIRQLIKTLPKEE